MPDKLDQVLEELKDQGETLVRIDERTIQHEKRMDRTDRKSTGLGAIAGLVGGFVAGMLRGWN